jgi:small subunit ribosomal protein S16
MQMTTTPAGSHHLSAGSLPILSVKNTLLSPAIPALSASPKTQTHQNTMSVVIRLRQEGSHNRAKYRVVAADKRKARDGAFLDILGTYDPQKDKGNATVDLAKVDAWISKGAQMSDTVKSLVKKARASAK